MCDGRGWDQVCPQWDGDTLISGVGWSPGGNWRAECVLTHEDTPPDAVQSRGGAETEGQSGIREGWPRKDLRVRVLPLKPSPWSDRHVEERNHLQLPEWGLSVGPDTHTRQLHD